MGLLAGIAKFKLFKAGARYAVRHPILAIGAGVVAYLVKKKREEGVVGKRSMESELSQARL